MICDVIYEIYQQITIIEQPQQHQQQDCPFIWHPHNNKYELLNGKFE